MAPTDIEGTTHSSLFTIRHDSPGHCQLVRFSASAGSLTYDRAPL